MKMISSIFAIAAVIATTDAVFEDFSQDALNNLQLTDPEHPTTFTSSMNFFHELKLDLVNMETQNEAKFKPDDSSQSDPDVPGTHPLCGNDLGLFILETLQTYCRLTSFHMVVDGDESNPHNIRFSMYFYKEGLSPLLLEIPVFKAPSTLALPTEVDWSIWALGERVGIVSPFDYEMLTETQAYQYMVINFLWLEDLLSFGITQRSVPAVLRVPGEEPRQITSYVTRPLLLTEKLMMKCKKVIASLNSPDYESVASYSPSSDDSPPYEFFPEE